MIVYHFYHILIRTCHLNIYKKVSEFFLSLDFIVLVLFASASQKRTRLPDTNGGGWAMIKESLVQNKSLHLVTWLNEISLKDLQ